MRRSQSAHTLLAVLLAAAPMGCQEGLSTGRLNASIKNAWMMYDEQRESLGAPSSERREFVESEIGRDQFATDVTHFVRTKYRREAIYALGWFGDERHVDAVVTGLVDNEPEVRRIALGAFARLTGREFSDPAQAHQWWQQQKTRRPP